jgi:hypothetical protein
MSAAPSTNQVVSDVLGIHVAAKAISGYQLRTHLVDTLGENGRNRADALSLASTEDNSPAFTPVTLWSRKNVNGDFRFNHIEDGHTAHDALTPTPKVPAQKGAWGKSAWEYEHAWFDSNLPPKVVHAIVRQAGALEVDEDNPTPVQDNVPS